VNSGAASLVLAMVLGKRLGWPLVEQRRDGKPTRAAPIDEASIDEAGHAETAYDYGRGAWQVTAKASAPHQAGSPIARWRQCSWMMTPRMLRPAIMSS
jgi:hypothetical protein